LASSAYPFLKRAFGGGFPVPLGLHPRDKERAQVYFTAIDKAGLTWVDVESDIREFFATTNANAGEVEKQLNRARKLRSR
jgi:hypothetical protein